MKNFHNNIYLGIQDRRGIHLFLEHLVRQGNHLYRGLLGYLRDLRDQRNQQVLDRQVHQGVHLCLGLQGSQGFRLHL